MNVQQTTTGTQQHLPTEPVGREAQLAAFLSLLQTPQSSAPVVISGPAGIGKTTLVKSFESLARDTGWRVVSETPVKGLTERIRGTYLPALYESIICHESQAFAQKSLTEQIEELGATLKQQGKGLLITIDHADKSAAQHLPELAQALVDSRRRNHPVQLVVAGRTAEIRDLLDSKALVGLESPMQFDLCALTRSQTESVLRRALESCVALNNKPLSEPLLTQACLATQGHPYMVYMVAEAIKRQVQDEFSESDLTCGINFARESLGDKVLEPLLAKLSAGDRAFLEAMAEDDKPSKMSDISSRLGKNPQYAGVYRNRLLESQIIRSASYGKVTFVIPHLREYLRASSLQSAEDSFNNF